jgi:hypothetical protein
MKKLVLNAALGLVASAAPAFAISGPPDPPGTAQEAPSPDVNIYGSDGSYQGYGRSDGRVNIGPPAPPGAAYDDRPTSYRIYGRDGSYRGRALGYPTRRGPPPPPRF